MKPIHQRLADVYRSATCGDEEAFAWLCAAHDWMHKIDDVVDGDLPKEAVPMIGATAVALMSTGFYLRHAAMLGPVLMSIAIQYQSSLTAPKEFVDGLRTAGNQLVLVMAYLKGGYAHAQLVAEELWPIVKESQIDE